MCQPGAQTKDREDREMGRGKKLGAAAGLQINVWAMAARDFKFIDLGSPMSRKIAGAGRVA